MRGDGRRNVSSKHFYFCVLFTGFPNDYDSIHWIYLSNALLFIIRLILTVSRQSVVNVLVAYAWTYVYAYIRVDEFE